MLIINYKILSYLSLLVIIQRSQLRHPVTRFVISFKLLTTRYYSAHSTKVVLRTKLGDSKLDPNWVAGFVDDEGCFHVYIRKKNNSKLGWQVKLRFSIGLHQKDQAILEYIQRKNYLGVGHIYKQGLNSVRFVIQSIEDLTKITEHLDLFPLFTEKRKDYERPFFFKKGMFVIKKKYIFFSITNFLKLLCLLCKRMNI